MTSIPWKTKMITNHNGNELFINDTVFEHRQLDSGRHAIIDLRTNTPLISVYHAYSNNREIHRLRTWEKEPIGKVADMNTDFWSMEINRSMARFRPKQSESNYCHHCGAKLQKGDES